MTHPKLAAVAALALACTAASAVVTDGNDVSLTSSDAFGGYLNASGSAAEVLNFTLASPVMDAFGFVGTIQRSTADINFTSVKLVGPGGSYSFTSAATDPVETWRPSVPALAAGAYALELSYTRSRAAQASYAATFETNALSEPVTYALLLAGLISVGFLATRRATSA